MFDFQIVQIAEFQEIKEVASRISPRFIIDAKSDSRQDDFQKKPEARPQGLFLHHNS